MVYVLKLDGLNLVLIGTALQVAAIRSGVAERMGRTPGGSPYLGILRRLTVTHMLEGDDDRAAEILDRFGVPEPRGTLPLAILGPELRRWLRANARPWDGREQSVMKVKGPERRPRPGLAGRLARRRARSDAHD